METYCHATGVLPEKKFHFLAEHTKPLYGLASQCLRSTRTSSERPHKRLSCLLGYQENMISYEYVEYATEGRTRVIVDRVITDWSREKRQRRGLKARLVMLAQVDRDQAVGSLIFKTDTDGIYYAKIRGNVALRPRLCLGPVNPVTEVTFLQRATEVNFAITPADADVRALARMRAVRADVSLRLKIRLEKLLTS